MILRVDPIDVRCRFCLAEEDAPCVQSGTADRDDAYRAAHPHRLRRVDAERLQRRVRALERLALR